MSSQQQQVIGVPGSCDAGSAKGMNSLGSHWQAHDVIIPEQWTTMNNGPHNANGYGSN